MERMLAALGNGVQRDESLFRGVRIVHQDCNLWTGEPIPMGKPPTGEPCAGEPHARFGGRKRRKPSPTPIAFKTNLVAEFDTSQLAADYSFVFDANWIVRHACKRPSL